MDSEDMEEWSDEETMDWDLIFDRIDGPSD